MTALCKCFNLPLSIFRMEAELTIKKDFLEIAQKALQCEGESFTESMPREVCIEWIAHISLGLLLIVIISHFLVYIAVENWFNQILLISFWLLLFVVFIYIWINSIAACCSDCNNGSCSSSAVPCDTNIKMAELDLACSMEDRQSFETLFFLANRKFEGQKSTPRQCDAASEFDILIGEKKLKVFGLKDFEKHTSVLLQSEMYNSVQCCEITLMNLPVQPTCWTLAVPHFSDPLHFIWDINKLSCNSLANSSTDVIIETRNTFLTAYPLFKCPVQDYNSCSNVRFLPADSEAQLWNLSLNESSNVHVCSTPSSFKIPWHSSLECASYLATSSMNKCLLSNFTLQSLHTDYFLSKCPGKGILREKPNVKSGQHSGKQMIRQTAAREEHRVDLQNAKTKIVFEANALPVVRSYTYTTAKQESINLVVRYLNSRCDTVARQKVSVKLSFLHYNDPPHADDTCWVNFCDDTLSVPFDFITKFQARGSHNFTTTTASVDIFSLQVQPAKSCRCAIYPHYSDPPVHIQCFGKYMLKELIAVFEILQFGCDFDCIRLLKMIFGCYVFYATTHANTISVSDDLLHLSFILLNAQPNSGQASNFFGTCFATTPNSSHSARAFRVFAVLHNGHQNESTGHCHLISFASVQVLKIAKRYNERTTGKINIYSLLNYLLMCNCRFIDTCTMQCTYSDTDRKTQSFATKLCGEKGVYQQQCTRNWRWRTCFTLGLCT